MALRTDTRDGVRVLVLDRPDRRNALSGELVAALREALAGIDADREVRAAVITGAGAGFCAGGDLKDTMGATAGADGFLGGHRGREAFAHLLREIRRCRVPVIAAVHGDAMGGGFGLAAACDLVVADPDARFGTPEIKVGLFPWIILAALLRDVPRKALFELAFTGGRWDAATAQRMGVVNRLSEPGGARAAGEALAREIASKSPAIVPLAKAAFHRADDLAFEDALAVLAPHLSLNLLAEDAAEGVSAFLAKREPVWKGR